MHHRADSMTKLCQGGEHNNAGGESIPMYYSSREEAELIVIGRSLNLSVRQRMDEFGLPAVPYKIIFYRNSNKIKCDLV